MDIGEQSFSQQHENTACASSSSAQLNEAGTTLAPPSYASAITPLCSTVLAGPHPSSLSEVRTQKNTSNFFRDNGSVESVSTRRVQEREISDQLSRCFTQIMPVVLDVDGLLHSFGKSNIGLKKYRGICSSIIKIGDSCFEAIIYASNTLHRFDAYCYKHDEAQSPSVADREALSKVFTDLTKLLWNVYNDLKQAHIEHEKLFQSIHEFIPKDAPLPEDIENGSITHRIAKLVKAEIVHHRGTDNISSIVDPLHALITEAGPYGEDCRGIVSWLEHLLEQFDLLARSIYTKRSIWITILDKFDIEGPINGDYESDL
ncbi:hypothetical protein CVT24_000063 [Panaeolus cyanescens]|uniref:Uncharacterized protein n=1 Tax=Panaeolus cyanescens TaxID=181874 RepID=A0A409VWE8_9AGAR|nr:hypothetical protein CVT24_000063 [Panaeolus cyanescens]